MRIEHGGSGARQEGMTDNDRMLFLKNILQLTINNVEDSTGGKFDLVDIAREQAWERSVIANSEAFGAWFESEAAQNLVHDYLSRHSDEDMEHGEGIDELIQAFRMTQAH